MCGLVGMITTTLTTNERKAMRDLIFMDTLRGDHSTGIATYVKGTGKDSGTWYYKRAVSGPDFLELAVPKRMLNDQWKVCMAHNRAATKGKINDKNAHPFHHDNIVGMHNGTLTSTLNLAAHKDFEVDSDNIFFDMSKNGAEVTIPKLRGAFCLTWIDTDNNTFNICRNSQRPMYIGWNASQNLFMYSSEEHILRAVVSGDRQGRPEIKLDNVKELPVGEWISIDMDTMKTVKKTLRLDTDPVTYPKYKSTLTPTRNSSQSGKGSSSAGTTSTTTSPSKRVVRITNWFPRVTHNGRSYIATGEDNLGHQSEVVISKSVYEIFADENREIPSTIEGKFMGGVVRNGKYITLVDATQSYRLSYVPATVSKAVQDVAPTQRVSIYKGFNNKPLSLKQFKRAMKVGCSGPGCPRVPSRKMHDSIFWLSHEDFLCEECTKDYRESKLAVTRNNGVTEVHPVQ